MEKNHPMNMNDLQEIECKEPTPQKKDLAKLYYFTNLDFPEIVGGPISRNQKATETGSQKKPRNSFFVASENLVESCVKVEALEGQVISKWVNIGCGPLPVTDPQPIYRHLLGAGGHISG